MLKIFATVAMLVAVWSGTASAQAPPAEAAQRQAGRISTMEAILEHAVSLGAENVLRQLADVMADRPSLSSLPEVRGFPLVDQGMFFYVQVPGLQLPVMWSMRQLLQGPDNSETLMTMEQLSRRIARLNGPESDDLRLLMRQLEMQLVPPQARPAAGRGISAASVSPDTPTRQRPAINAEVVDNPHAVYTREVKNALLAAILENGSNLGIGPNEWLTVAARDDEPRNPLIPSNTVDYSTWMVRVKGSDLAALRAGTLSLEDARQRVEIREN